TTTSSTTATTSSCSPPGWSGPRSSSTGTDPRPRQKRNPARGGVSFAADGALQQRHQQQRDDVDDLDQRVDRRARGVLVGIADGVAGHRCLVGLGALAAEVAFLDVLLGVVPGAAAGTHRN